AELGQQQLEKQMQQARHEMELAAQRMAQLSLQMQGPMLSRMSHMFDPNRAVLGVSIAENPDAKNAQGVRVLAVTPGGPADQAGLRAGDTITAINGTVFRAGAQPSANDQLLNFMDKVKPGDTLKLSYVRAGKPHSVTLKAGKLSEYSFAFDVPPPPVPAVPPVPPVPPLQPENLRALFPPGWWGAWGAMQLTQLTSGLGQYFGTDKGLLVVRAPRDAALKLQDGDVILKIGDREPATPAEAMRILYSYAPGEPLKLGILRKGKPLTLDVIAPKAPGPVSVYQPMHLNDW
ncbi:MAG: PDZ domain-containing protein, partial [Gammaproteobacteria bacterium]|nr:PDZ domain-containing protein [Gammaproteobacteria bacterium]